MEGDSVSSNEETQTSLTKTNPTTKNLRTSTRFLFDGIHSTKFHLITMTRDRPYAATYIIAALSFKTVIIPSLKWARHKT